MAITWGAAVADATNAFRIGYEFSQSPATIANGTTSATVTLKIYLGTKYYAYDSGASWSISGNISASGTSSFNHTSSTAWSASNVTLLATRTRTVTPSFSGTVATSITASVNGLAAIAGTASVSGTWTTAKRPIIAPDAPSNLNLAAVSDSQTNLTWTNNNPTDPAAPYTNIEVERYDYATGVYTLLARLGVVTSYSATGQVADGKYAYRVRATNTAGPSSYAGGSGPVYTTPATPTSVKATKTGAQQITLNWVNNAKYDGELEVWRRVNGVRDGTVYTVASPTSTSLVLNSLPTTSALSWELRAHVTDTTAIGTVYSAYSAVSNAITLTNAAPGAVSSVTPATGTITTPIPTLGLTMAAIATGQTQKGQWQFATDTGFTTNVQLVEEADADLRLSGATTESPTLTQLVLTNGTWYMRARAVDTDGTVGPWSATNTLTVNTPAPPTPTAVVPAAAATVTTLQPTLSATVAADSVGRLTKVEWTLATNNTFTTGVRTIIEDNVDLTASGTHTEVVPLASKIGGNGTWYVRARSLSNDGAFSAWTTAQSFTLTMAAPPTPTFVTPVDGATISTDFPTLGCTLGVASENRRSKAEYQLATDSGFTANVRTITEPDTELSNTRASVEPVPANNGLFQGTWYYRVRGVDEYGQTSAWTTTQTFIVTHKPTAVPSSPTGDNAYIWQNTTFSWTMSDPEPTDVQSAYQLVIERNDTGVVVYDSGKVSSALKTATVTTANLLKDVKLRWKIRIYDSDDVVSNYSPYQLFTVSDPPIPTLTSPTSGQQIGTGQPTIAWNLDAATTQASYRVVITRTSDNVKIIDSNTVSTSTQSWTAPSTILQNNVNYSVSVTITDVMGLSTTVTNPFSTSYQAPDPVIYDTSGDLYDDEGYIGVDWSNMSPDPFFVQWNVYRRKTGEQEWTKIASYTDSTVTSYHDWNASAGDNWEYAVTQHGGRSGLVLESPINPAPDTINAAASHYWLINADDESNNLKIDIVTQDDYSDEYDQEDMIVIGRGRKVNHGTRHGYSGSLTAQLRDTNNETARSKRQRLQQIKSSLSAYYLRNPFGDIYLVAVGNLSFSRIAGVGTSEYVDVTIPYMEVF